MQEVEACLYSDFYKDHLDIRLDYDSRFHPRGKFFTLSDRSTVDGCATFWRRNLFTLVEQINIDFYQKISTDPRFSKNQEVLSRHIRKDNGALITLLRHVDGALLMVVNVHLYWDQEYSDVKLYQAVSLMEEVEKARKRHPEAKIFLVGDFNCFKDSNTYELITECGTRGEEFMKYNYSVLDGSLRHNIRLMDAYANQEMTFTNYTPTFKGVIDYIFYEDGLTLMSVLSPVEDEYTERTIGLPNIHFPSDHIFIGSRFGLGTAPSESEKPV